MLQKYVLDVAKPFFLIHIHAQLARPQLPADLLDLQLHCKRN